MPQGPGVFGGQDIGGGQHIEGAQGDVAGGADRGRQKMQARSEGPGPVRLKQRLALVAAWLSFGEIILCHAVQTLCKVYLPPPNA